MIKPCPFCGQAIQAMIECVKSFYIGNGKVVCTNELRPHLKKFNELIFNYKAECQNTRVLPSEQREKIREELAEYIYNARNENMHQCKIHAEAMLGIVERER